MVLQTVTTRFKNTHIYMYSTVTSPSTSWWTCPSKLFGHSLSRSPLVCSIPYGQYLRLQRNCSDDKKFKMEADQLYIRLSSRGYSRTCLKKAYNRVIGKQRVELLSKVTKRPMPNTTWVITTYSDQHKQIRDIMYKHWHLLTRRYPST